MTPISQITPATAVEAILLQTLVRESATPAGIVDCAQRLCGLMQAEGLQFVRPEIYSQLRDLIIDAFSSIAADLRDENSPPDGRVSEIDQDIAEARLLVAIGSERQSAA